MQVRPTIWRESMLDCPYVTVEPTPIGCRASTLSRGVGLRIRLLLARRYRRSTQLSQYEDFSLYRIYFNPPGDLRDQGAVVACVLLDGKGEVVGFCRREPAADRNDADELDDGSVVNGLLAEWEVAWNAGQLTQLWDESIRHCSNTLSVGDPESITVSDLSSVEVLLELALAAPSVQSGQQSVGQRRADSTSATPEP